MYLIPQHQSNSNPNPRKEAREVVTSTACASKFAPSSPMKWNLNPKKREKCLLCGPEEVNLLPHHQWNWSPLVAQLVEHWVVMREVVSSTPAGSEFAPSALIELEHKSKEEREVFSLKV